MFRFHSTVWLTVIAMLCLSSCTRNAGVDRAASGRDDKPVVIATIPMIADIAREIAGDHFKVETLLNPTTDPHTYQPVGADMSKMSSAQAVLYNGLLLEGAIEADLQKHADRMGSVVAVGETVAKSRLRTPADFAGHPDPHIWMDVSLWAEIVPAILTTLQELDPEHEGELSSNAEQVQVKLAQLHEYAQLVIGTIPKDQRFIVTAHDAFGYFGVAYGVEVSSVQGVSTESEAGLEDIQDLVDLIVSKKIPAIFFETSVTRKNLEAIIDGVRAAGHEVSDGGKLFSDSAGTEDTWEGTYFGMMEHNVNTLAKSLGGTVPEGGFRAVLEQSAEPTTVAE